MSRIDKNSYNPKTKAKKKKNLEKWATVLHRYFSKDIQMVINFFSLTTRETTMRFTSYPLK